MTESNVRNNLTFPRSNAAHFPPQQQTLLRASSYSSYAPAADVFFPLQVFFTGSKARAYFRVEDVAVTNGQEKRGGWGCDELSVPDLVLSAHFRLAPPLVAVGNMTDARPLIPPTASAHSPVSPGYCWPVHGRAPKQFWYSWGWAAHTPHE